MHIEIFRSKTIDRCWYFRFRARNGKIVAQSEGYKRRGAAVRMAVKITRLGGVGWDVPIKELK